MLYLTKYFYKNLRKIPRLMSKLAPADKPRYVQKKLVLSHGSIFGLLLLSNACANSNSLNPFYIGLDSGVGSTSWDLLVPTNDKQNAAMSVSTPIRVREGGGVYGIFSGYEFTPYFALETSYKRFPKAQIMFDTFSIYAFEHEGCLVLNSNTYAINLLAKLMLKLPKTPLKLYSSFGIAGVHRSDEIRHQLRITPSFGVGFNLSISPHFFLELGSNYTAGYGVAELRPVNHFIPFLYSATLGLAYRI